MAVQESRDPVASSLRDEDLIDLLGRRLPDLLQRRPELEPEIFGAFLKTFARRDEVALIVKELRELRGKRGAHDSRTAGTQAAAV